MKTLASDSLVTVLQNGTFLLPLAFEDDSVASVVLS